MREHGNLKFVARFKEAVSDTAGKGKRFRVTMLMEGLGNFGDSFYYSKAAIESAPPIFEGRKFMLDHPGEFDEANRPERSVKDISGYFENCAAEVTDDGRLALMGDLVVAGDPTDPTDPFKRERVLILESIDYSEKHTADDLVALSINAGGDFETLPIEQFMETADIPDACKPKLMEAVEQGVTQVRLVSAMQTATSCDLVTTAGAGGSINQLLEGSKRNMKVNKNVREAGKTPKPGATPTDDDTAAGGAAAGGAADGSGAGDDGDGDADGSGDADGQTGDHADAGQDEELIKSMLDKYCGQPDHSADDKTKMQQAYEAALEAGYEGKEAEKAAGAHMKMSKQAEAKQMQAQREADEAEAHEAGTDGVLATKGPSTVGAAGSAKDMQKNKESARRAQGGNDVVKLTAEVARLSGELASMRLKEHMDKALRESKLPMSATKKFREAVKNVRSVRDFDEKLGLFKEAFGLRGEAQETGGFMIESEKQGGSDGEAEGFDFSDCAGE
jgi:hypothetical protein